MPQDGQERSNEKQERTSANNEKNRLNNIKFYHGVQRKEEVAKLMKTCSVGEFLLRSVFTRTEVALGLVLSVKVATGGDQDSNIHHYVIEYKTNEYTLMQEFKDKEGVTKRTPSQAFPTLEAMFDYYKQHRLACRIRLTKPIRRPPWQLRHSQIRFEESGKLGSGNFCIVYKGKLHLKRARDGNDMKDVAIKVSKDGEKEPMALMETRNLLFAEARIMMNYKHVNVIRLYGLACDLPPFMVCMEFCSGGSLEDALHKFGKDMEEFERQILLLECSRGMRYLHTQKCVHRDLASRNCLISTDGFVKIADFGLSKTLEKNEKAFKEALKEAPLAWLAPECIQKESEFSSKTDVWAFGVVIFEVYNNGAKLFAGENDTVMLRKIKRANMPSLDAKTTLPAMQAILSSIWTRKPDDRPEFQRILELLVEALIPITREDLKKMQINNLKGVNRVLMPNTDTGPDELAAEDQLDADASEKMKKTRMERLEKQKKSNRRLKSKHSRTTCTTLVTREEQPKSKKRSTPTRKQQLTPSE